MVKVVPVTFSSRRVLLDLLIRYGGHQPNALPAGIRSLLGTFPDEGNLGVPEGGYDVAIEPLAVARLVPDVSKEKFDERAHLLFETPGYGFLHLINAEEPDGRCRFLDLRPRVGTALAKNYPSNQGLQELVAKSDGVENVFTTALDGIYFGNAYEVVGKKFGELAARGLIKPEGISERFNGVGERMYKVELIRFEDEENKS